MGIVFLSPEDRVQILWFQITNKEKSDAVRDQTVTKQELLPWFFSQQLPKPRQSEKLKTCLQVRASLAWGFSPEGRVSASVSGCCRPECAEPRVIVHSWHVILFVWVLINLMWQGGRAVNVNGQLVDRSYDDECNNCESLQCSEV